MNMVLRFTTCLMPSRTRTKTSKNKLGFWRWTLHIHICHQIFTVLLIYSCILKSTFIRSSIGQHSVRGGRLQPADRSQRKEGARSSVSLGRGGGGEPRAQRLPQTEDHADVSSFHMRWIGGKTVSNCHLFFCPISCLFFTEPTCRIYRKWPRTCTTRTSAQTASNGVEGCPPMVMFCLCLLRTYLSVSLLSAPPPSAPNSRNSEKDIMNFEKLSTNTASQVIQFSLMSHILMSATQVCSSVAVTP